MAETIKFNCTVCGSRIKADPSRAGTTAKCPQCGELLRVPGDPPHQQMKPPPIAERVGTTPKTNPEKLKADASKLAATVVGGCLLAMLAPIIFIGGCIAMLPEHVETTEDYKDMAAIIAQNRIRDTLKAPSTASFAWDSDVISLGGERYRVSSHVDAENSFGAKIRTQYTMVLRRDPSMNSSSDAAWTVESLDVQ